MCKEIKIFIASSIVDFKTERSELQNFLWGISEDFEKIFNVRIKPIYCENIDSGYRGTRSQESINNKLKECDICLFLIKNRIGDYTLEEFNLALELLKNSKNNLPILYVYFNSSTGIKQDDSVKNFKENLRDLECMYFKFLNIETIKYNILVSLLRFLHSEVDLGYSNDRLHVNGNTIKNLDFYTVLNYSNNKQIKNLLLEKSNCEKKIEVLSINGKDSLELKRTLIDRENILAKIKEHTDLIISLSNQLFNNQIDGTLTKKQYIAYNFILEGEYQKADELLNFEDLKGSFLKNCITHLNEVMTKIIINKSSLYIDNRDSKIIEMFEYVLLYCIKYNICLSYIYDYAFYLNSVNNSNKALEVLSLLEKCLIDNKDLILKLRMYNLYGIIYANLINEQGRAVEYYEKSVALCDINEGCRKYAANAYNNMGKYYKVSGHYELAKQKYVKALEIYSNLREKESNKFNVEVLSCYNNLGNLHREIKEYDTSRKYFEDAVSIIDKLLAVGEKHEIYATVYNSYGVLFKEKHEYENALILYDKSLLLYKEFILHEPQKFNISLAKCYNNIANLLVEKKDNLKAKEYYLRATNIFNQMYKINHEKFMHEFSVGLCNLGDFYIDICCYDKAKYVLLKVMDMQEYMLEFDFCKICDSLKNTYESLCRLYIECNKNADLIKNKLDKLISNILSVTK